MYMPEGNLRDIWGFRSFDRQLYIYHAWINQHVSQSVPGTGEVRRTGEISRTEIMWSVIAPNREMADFAFDDRHKTTSRNHFDAEIISVEMVPIAAEIGGVSHG